MPLTFALVFSLLAPVPGSLQGVPVPPALASDAWVAEDKLKHAFTAFAFVGFVQAGARTASLHGNAATVLAAALGAGVSLGKEVFDRRHGGLFSVRDLAWDALGIGLGVLLASNVRR